MARRAWGVGGGKPRFSNKGLLAAYRPQLAQYLSLPGIAGNMAWMPDSALVSVLGDIDIIVKVAPIDWTNAATIQTLIAKRAALCSWQLRIAQLTGRIDFIWSEDGTVLLPTSSSIAVPGIDNKSIFIRFTFDVDDGSGNRIANFYTSENGIIWNQLGIPIVVAGVTSIFDSDIPIEIGSIGFGGNQFLNGSVYYAEVRNGIDGPAVAKFDPSRALRNASQVSSETGETWTINTAGGGQIAQLF